MCKLYFDIIQHKKKQKEYWAAGVGYGHPNRPGWLVFNVIYALGKLSVNVSYPRQQ